MAHGDAAVWRRALLGGWGRGAGSGSLREPSDRLISAPPLRM